MKLNIRILIPLCTLMVTCAYAEPEEKADDEKAKEGQRAWFVQTGIPAEMDNPVKVLLGKKVKMLTLSNRTASSPVRVPKDGIIQLVKEVPDPTEEGKVMYKPFAKAFVPKAAGDVLIVMVPRAKPAEDGTIYEVKVQSLKSFKGGDFLYLNLTNRKVGIEIDNDKFSLDPGSMKIHGLKGGEKVVSIPYRYSYFQEERDRWMPLNASMTILSNKRREVFVFSVSENTGRIRCKGITIAVDA